MPTPPLSPKPQRWKSRSDEPHPDIQALLSTFDTSSSTDEGSISGLPNSRSEPGRGRQAGSSGGQSDGRTAPEIAIRTTSPSPRRIPLPSPHSRSSTRSLSPLDIPPQSTGSTSYLGRGVSVSGPRANTYGKCFSYMKLMLIP